MPVSLKRGAELENLGTSAFKTDAFVRPSSSRIKVRSFSGGTAIALNKGKLWIVKIQNVIALEPSEITERRMF